MALTAKQKKQLEILKQLEAEDIAEQKKLVADINKFLRDRYGKGWKLSELDILVNLWKQSQHEALPSEIAAAQPQKTTE